MIGFVREILNGIGTQGLCEDPYGIHVLDKFRVFQSLPLEFLIYSINNELGPFHLIHTTYQLVEVER
jgi:hypothetical protein